MTEFKALRRRLSIEAFVIVGSILLAFAIDAAWDRFQEGLRGQEYVVALRGEFEEARLEMVEQLRDRTIQLDAVDSLLQAIDSSERSTGCGPGRPALRHLCVRPVAASLRSARKLKRC